MKLCTYELKILKLIRDKMRPVDPGAAFWQAVESLSSKRLISNGELTELGVKALSNE